MRKLYRLHPHGGKTYHLHDGFAWTYKGIYVIYVRSPEFAPNPGQGWTLIASRDLSIKPTSGWGYYGKQSWYGRGGTFNNRWTRFLFGLDYAPRKLGQLVPFAAIQGKPPKDLLQYVKKVGAGNPAAVLSIVEMVMTLAGYEMTEEGVIRQRPTPIRMVSPVVPIWRKAGAKKKPLVFVDPPWVYDGKTLWVGAGKRQLYLSEAEAGRHRIPVVNTYEGWKMALLAAEGDSYPTKAEKKARMWSKLAQDDAYELTPAPKANPSSSQRRRRRRR